MKLHAGQHPLLPVSMTRSSGCDTPLIQTLPPLTFTLSLDLLPECADNKNLSWKPAFLSNEELGQLMLEVRSIDEEL